MKSFFPAASLVDGEHLSEELAFIFRLRFRQLREVLRKIRGKGHGNRHAGSFHRSPPV